jgi:hypothetical protein
VVKRKSQNSTFGTVSKTYRIYTLFLLLQGGYLGGTRWDGYALWWTLLCHIGVPKQTGEIRVDD